MNAVKTIKKYNEQSTVKTYEEDESSQLPLSINDENSGLKVEKDDNGRDCIVATKGFKKGDKIAIIAHGPSNFTHPLQVTDIYS